MFDPKTIVDGVVLPAIVCTAVLLTALGLQRFVKGQFLGRSAPALALGSAVMAAQMGLHGWPGWLPGEAWQWMAHLALAAALVAMVTVIDAVPTVIHLILRLALSFAVIFPVLRPIVQFEWDATESMAHLSVLTLLCFVYGFMLQKFSCRAGDIQSGLFCVCLAGSTALVLALSGSLSLAHLAGSLPSALMVAVVLSAWLRSKIIFGPAVPVLVILLVFLWLNGYYYAQLTITNAALLVGSGIMAWIMQTIPRAKPASWKTAAVRLVPALVPLAVAVTLAAFDFAKDMGSPY